MNYYDIWVRILSRPLDLLVSIDWFSTSNEAVLFIGKKLVLLKLELYG